jgi:hypothetical protein
MKPTVFVGYDQRETAAYGACVNSLRAHSPDVAIQPISRLLLGGLYRRPTSRRELPQKPGHTVLWDDLSAAPMSTDFALARFWVPFLQRSGPALFCDVDFLWRAPVDELFALFEEKYVVQVVKHGDLAEANELKMDGQQQLGYARKNWSSLMLFNCDRFKQHENLLNMLNGERGLALQQFSWVDDERIGALPFCWNWLEGLYPLDHGAQPCAVHFTRGTPDMPGYENAAFADEWRTYAGRTTQ